MNSKEIIDPNIKLRNKVHSRTCQAVSSQSRGKEGFFRPNIHTNTRPNPHTQINHKKELIGLYQNQNFLLNKRLSEENT